MRIFYVLLFFFISCTDDKEYLASDFRIFKETKSWKLAKYVGNNDVDGIERELAKDSSLLSFQESKYGMSVLHLAIYNDKFEAFNKLLNLGFKLNLYDYATGSTPFLMVCGELDEKDYYKYFDLLIKKGVDINQTMLNSDKIMQDLGYSALMYATSKGNIKIVQNLINLGVNINYLNAGSRNAFSVAVNTNHLAIATLLLSNGSDCKAMIHVKYDEYQNPRPIFVCEFLKKNKFITRDEVFFDLEKLVNSKNCCQ